MTGAADTCPVLGALGLDLPPGAIEAAALEAALAGTLRDSGVQADRLGQRPNQRHAALRKTARDLAIAGSWRELAALGQALGAELPDHQNLLRLYVMALERLGRAGDIRRTIDTLDGLPLDRPVVDLMRQAVTRRRIAPTIADYRRFWGPPSEDLDRALAGLPVSEPDTRLTALAAALAKLQGRGPGETDAFRDRLHWGQEAYQYHKFLKLLAGICAKRAAAGEVLSDDERRCIALFDETEARVLPCDPGPVRARQAEGRSILFAQAHAGMSLAANRITEEAGLPVDLIKATEYRFADTDGENTPDVLVVRNTGFQLGFLRLAKRLRREQRVIRIHPDGPDGEQGDFDLLGRKVTLGLGAATLAWHGRAATFFAGTRWQGTRIQPYLRAGPVADRSGSREDFEAAFHGFYLDCLKDILLGPPEDMIRTPGILDPFIADSESDRQAS